MTKKVLITGAAGGIGRVTVAHLLASGYHVRALDPRFGTNQQPEVEVFVGSCSDVSIVKSAIEGVDAVIHLAAIPGPFPTGREAFINNVSATMTVLSCAAEAGVTRAAIASSISALGFVFGRPTTPKPTRLPIDELEGFNAVEDGYGLSKQTDEAIAEMIHRSSGMQILSLRLPFTTTHVDIAARAEKFRNQKEIEVGVREFWSYLDVRDAARAFRLAIESSIGGARVINIGARETLSLLSTPELIRRYYPDIPVTRQLGESEPLFSVEKAEKLLGFVADYEWSIEV